MATAGRPAFAGVPADSSAVGAGRFESSQTITHSDAPTQTSKQERAEVRNGRSSSSVPRPRIRAIGLPYSQRRPAEHSIGLQATFTGLRGPLAASASAMQSLHGKIASGGEELQHTAAHAASAQHHAARQPAETATLWAAPRGRAAQHAQAAVCEGACSAQRSTHTASASSYELATSTAPPQLLTDADSHCSQMQADRTVRPGSTDAGASSAARVGVPDACASDAAAAVSDVSLRAGKHASAASIPAQPLPQLGRQASCEDTLASTQRHLHTDQGSCPTQLRVACVTWNMGRCKVADALQSQLPDPFLGCQQGAHATQPDVLIVGTQETSDAPVWFDMLVQQLLERNQQPVPGAFSVTSAPGGSFSMTVAVFAHASLLPWLSNVQVGRVTCGMGNKVCQAGIDDI